MFNWNYILTGKKHGFPNSYPARTEDLYPDGLPLGSVGLGMQGSGKTTAMARMMQEHALKYPDEPIIFFDVSQSITDEFFKIVLSLPEKDKEAILKRVIYDELGHPEWVLTLPEFHEDHGVPFEKQVQRVPQNLLKINP